MYKSKQIYLENYKKMPGNILTINVSAQPISFRSNNLIASVTKETTLEIDLDSKPDGAGVWLERYYLAEPEQIDGNVYFFAVDLTFDKPKKGQAVRVVVGTLSNDYTSETDFRDCILSTSEVNGFVV